MLGEGVCKHKLSPEILHDHVALCHAFRHKKMADVDTTRALRSRLAAVYKRYANGLIFTDDHGLVDVTLLRDEVLKMDRLCNGVGEADELCLGA